jgi:hypothetical protein
MSEADASCRKYKRYWLTVPLVFSWKDAKGTRHEEVGLTRDMSIAGTFVFTFTKNAPPLHTAVTLKASLPAYRTAAPALLIRGQGRVVRVESAHSGNLGGFGVAGKRFVIRRAEERR